MAASSRDSLHGSAWRFRPFPPLRVENDGLTVETEAKPPHLQTHLLQFFDVNRTVSTHIVDGKWKGRTDQLVESRTAQKPRPEQKRLDHFRDRLSRQAQHRGDDIQATRSGGNYLQVLLLDRPQTQGVDLLKGTRPFQMSSGDRSSIDMPTSWRSRSLRWALPVACRRSCPWWSSSRGRGAPCCGARRG